MTVCFTGHRRILPDTVFNTVNLLENKITELAQTGREVVFRAGGAMGFDTLAALCVLAQRDAYPNIKLHLILPCRTQTRGWSDSDVEKYNYILSEADDVRFLYDKYNNHCMHERNRALLDGADLCICYYDGSPDGGTAYTVELAKKRGVGIENFCE